MTTAKNSIVRGVRLFELHSVQDAVRGNLTAGEFALDLPFIPRRYFITYSIPTSQTRGEHAHRVCEQFLTCVNGSCIVAVDDGTHREEFHLDRPSLGVYVPPLVWAVEFHHSADSVLLVFASHSYEPADYVRDYSAFLELVKP